MRSRFEKNVSTRSTLVRVVIVTSHINCHRLYQLHNMAEYHNPEDEVAFEEFRQLWRDTIGLQRFLSLRGTELVTYQSTQLVMDRFDPNKILSRAVAMELLERIWINQYNILPLDIPGSAETTWDPFYLDDYTLYDLLWITLFHHYLAGQQESWGLCASCRFPSILSQTHPDP